MLEAVVVAIGKPEHDANYREREVTAIRFHQIDLVQPFHLIEQPVGNVGDNRPDRLDAAALKRRVDQPSEPAMLGVVVADHVEGEQAERARQQPQDARLRHLARVRRIAHECVVILQEHRARVVCRAKCDPAHDRQLHRYNGALDLLQRGTRVRVKTGRNNFNVCSWITCELNLLGRASRPAREC